MSDAPKHKNNSGVILLVLGVVLLGLGWYISRPPEVTPERVAAQMQSPGQTTPPPAPLATTEDMLPQPEAQNSTQPPADSDPSSTQKPKPVVEADGRFIGDKNAPVQMIEFSSLSCPHCAHFHNEVLDELRMKYVDTGKVRIEFRAFPLNQPALDATKLLYCLPDSQYYPFMSMLFETQNQWAFRPDYQDVLKQNAKLAGLSDADIKTCLENKESETKLIEGLTADIKKYDLKSTPTFIINEGAAQVIGGGSISEFSSKIDPLITEKTQENQTVTTPTPESQPAP